MFKSQLQKTPKVAKSFRFLLFSGKDQKWSEDACSINDFVVVVVGVGVLVLVDCTTFL
jgi:hypothetical protein